MAELLEICALDAHYGDFQALFGVDLTLVGGETVAVIGANGAGKSTLMKSIMGLVKNRADAIRLRGAPVGDRPAYRLAVDGVSLVPEGRRLFRSLSVAENLVIGGRLKRPGHWSLATVYGLFPVLKERCHAPAEALSGGQRQMVAIGRALMANPDILMIDEASLGLAPTVVKDIYRAFPAIRAEGTAILLVEQDIAQAMGVADRVVCLQEGRVALEGAPGELGREAITAAYFGAAP
ncbi:MAG: ABC transporter ATP-binding protein [Pseudomonadota bacterium]